MNRLRRKIASILLSAVMLTAAPAENLILSVKAAEVSQNCSAEETSSTAPASADEVLCVNEGNEETPSGGSAEDFESANDQTAAVSSVIDAAADNAEIIISEPPSVPMLQPESNIDLIEQPSVDAEAAVSDAADPAASAGNETQALTDSTTFAAGNDNSAEEDTILEYQEAVPGSATGQWYIDSINAVKAAGYSTGDGTVIAVIDTGINTELSVFEDADISGDEGSGHGTRVAGILVGSSDQYKGLVPDASVISYNTAGSSGGLSVSKVTQAIKDATERGVDVINLSLGITQYNMRKVSPQVALALKAMEAAIQDAIGKGIAVVASAGNEASGYINAGEEIQLDFPASIDGVIAVTGLAKSNGNYVIWSSSCYGEGTTIAAPSVGIKTPTDTDGYSYNNGTSFSAPMVSAAISSLLSLDKKSNGGSRTLSLDKIKEILTSSAKKIADGDPLKYGAGLLDINNMLRTYLKDVMGIDPGPDEPDAGTGDTGSAGGSGGSEGGNVDPSDPQEVYVDIDDFVEYLEGYDTAGDEVLSVHDGECTAHEYEYRILVQPSSEQDGIGEFICKYCGHSVKFLMLGYDAFQQATAEAVLNSKGGKVTVATSKWDSFNSLVANALKQRPDVELNVYYLSGNKVMCFTIPSGTDISLLYDKEMHVGFKAFIR